MLLAKVRVFPGTAIARVRATCSRIRPGSCARRSAGSCARRRPGAACRGRRSAGCSPGPRRRPPGRRSPSRPRRRFRGCRRRPRRITGRPLACAWTVVMPNSSTLGTISARQTYRRAGAAMRCSMPWRFARTWPGPGTQRLDGRLQLDEARCDAGPSLGLEDVDAGGRVGGRGALGHAPQPDRHAAVDGLADRQRAPPHAARQAPSRLTSCWGKRESSNPSAT